MESAYALFSTAASLRKTPFGIKWAAFVIPRVKRLHPDYISCHLFQGPALMCLLFTVIDND